MKYHNIAAALVPTPENLPLVRIEGMEQGDAVTISGLHPGESGFFLREADPLYLMMVNTYRMASEGILPLAKAEDLERVVQRGIAYQQGNRALMHLPD